MWHVGMWGMRRGVYLEQGDEWVDDNNSSLLSLSKMILAKYRVYGSHRFND